MRRQPSWNDGEKTWRLRMLLSGVLILFAPRAGGVHWFSLGSERPKSPLPFQSGAQTGVTQ